MQIGALSQTIASESEVLSGTYKVEESLSRLCMSEGANCMDSETAYREAVRKRVAAMKSKCPAGRPLDYEDRMDRLTAAAESYPSVISAKATMETACASEDGTCRQQKAVHDTSARLSEHLAALRAQRSLAVAEQQRASKKLREYLAEKNSRCSQP